MKKVKFYSRKHKTLFIHIPKTGGSTIRSYLINDFDRIFEAPPKHMYDFSFAFVRNPFTRFCSALSMFKHGSAWVKNQDKYLSVDKVISILEDESISHDNIASDFNQYLKHHMIPMTHPYNCIDLAGKTYKFEEYSDAYKDISDRLGICKPEKQINKSKCDLDYKEILSKDQIKKIEEIFKDDFEAFNY